MSPDKPREPPWPEIRDLFVKGQVIPFLGAGSSAYCHQVAAPPTGGDLCAELAQRARIDINCSFGCKKSRYDLPRLASYYQTCVSTRPRLDDLLKTTIGNPEFLPNPLHRLLAAVARHKPLLIITTNYDNLLEKAFDVPDDRGMPVPYEVVVTQADELAYADEADSDQLGPEHAGAVWHWVSGQDADFHPVMGSHLTFDLSERSVIYKIHGSVPRCDNGWRGGYLIAEEDYARFLGQMQNIIPPAIISLIGTKVAVGYGSRTVPLYSLLFLGYGMHDWNLRVLLEELQVGRRMAGQEQHYAFMRALDPMEEALLKKRGVEPYNCDLQEMVSTMTELLHDHLRPN